MIFQSNSNVNMLQLSCRSGTEEEYSELSQLLDDISSYSRDMVVLQTQEREAKNKEKSDKQKGEEMRKAAMELMGSMFLY